MRRKGSQEGLPGLNQAPVWGNRSAGEEDTTRKAHFSLEPAGWRELSLGPRPWAGDTGVCPALPAGATSLQASVSTGYEIKVLLPTPEGLLES